MNSNNILEKIFNHKSREIEERKIHYPAKTLEQKPGFPKKPISLSGAVQKKDSTGVIAEFKTRSPSMGSINEQADVKTVTQGYVKAGATALSVLTDSHFFGGSMENLGLASETNDCPILQKDFVMDEYQIIEAKAWGADAILLIAAMLTKEKIQELSSFAASLGLETLFEVHRKEELDKLNEHIHIVGVNNRNLKDFSVNQENSVDMVNSIPRGFVRIAESGIESPKEAFNLLNSGFNGLLIGGQFMKHPKPEEACRDFIDQLKVYNQKDKELK